MPYSPHYKVRVNGVFASDLDNPYEIWSWGFSYGSAATVVPDPVDPIGDVFDGLVDAITSYHQDPGTNVASVCRLTQIKCSAIGRNGRVTLEEDGSYRQREINFSPEEFGGGGGGLEHPPQVAMCVTLQAVRAGRHGLGRWFLPGPAIAMTPSGVISTANRDGVAVSTKAFIDAVNLIDDTANAVCVAGSDGITSPVNIFRVGQVLDTQRRRRNAMSENYVLTAVNWTAG